MITAGEVRRCREDTGQSMMECKASLMATEHRRELEELLVQAVGAGTISELREVLTTLISYRLREIT